MKTPKNGSKITKKWIEFIVQHHVHKLNPEITVVVNDFQCKNATKPGESFNAELVLIDISAVLTAEGKENENKDYSFVAKFLSTDPFNRETIIKLGYHIRELTMYSSLVTDLNNFQREKTGNKYSIQLPQFVYGKCTRNEYVLVMQNVKACGYNVTSKHEGLSPDQGEAAMRHIARLHALSYSYNQHDNIVKKYPCFKFSDVLSPLFKSVVYVSLDNAVRFLKNTEGYGEIASQLERGRRKLPPKFEALWDDLSRHKILCLCHGDYWLSNLMFAYDDEKRVSDLTIIDWQISMWNNPVMDLHYLLNTSTTRKMRENHKDHLLRSYHAEFVEITDSLGTPVSDWGYEQFLAEFERLSLVGFLMGLCLIQGTLSKAGEAMTQQSQGGNGSLAWLGGKIKASAAKVIVPVAFHPANNWMIRSVLKKKMEPVVAELVSQTNDVMNDRLLSLVQEAEDKGLLDVLNL